MTHTQAQTPTRQQILADFKKWTAKGGDRQFQFERVVRRWIACGYAIAELPLLISAPKEAYDSAILKTSQA